MPTSVRIVEWEPGWEIPLHELDRELFDVPSVGAPYWRGNVAMRVREVEDTEPVRVHMERDLARELQVLDGLPAGCTIDCGRDSRTGHWHAVVERGAAVVGSAVGDDCDEVVRQAISMAVRRD